MDRALGRYELIRPLARGGMAEVFLARRRVAGVEKRVVVKRIRAGRTTDPRFLEMFVREARLSMALVHQNVVPVFDFGRAGDDLFLVMEHIDGCDLGAALARAGSAGAPADPLLVAFIGAECAQALDYAHSRRGPDGSSLGVVHRDVTPRNLLLSWMGEVKLVDFGVAWLTGEPHGRVRGTPAYMAPEQARGEPVDGRADLFALGLVLWEALAGRRARVGTDVAALLAEARAGAQLEPLADVPDALAQIIRRATAPRPDDRPADARVLQEELDAFLVAARAARPDQQPNARRLAAWLHRLWPTGGEPAPPLATEPVEGLPNAVTFLEDGEAGVLGGQTARSFAETAAGDEAPAPTPAPAPDPAGANHRPPRRPIARVAGLLAAAAVVALAFALLRAPARPGSSGAADAAAVAAGPAAAPPDGGAAAVPAADAAPLPRAMTPARARTRPRAPQLDAASAAAPRRRVTFGARPWANFFIDGSPAQHQTPESVELAPGRHSVRFENPELGVVRTVAIDVPADRDIEHVETMVRQ